ncbi:MAG: PEGA domain-containing protein [Thermoguttaceae bacterium]
MKTCAKKTLLWQLTDGNSILRQLILVLGDDAMLFSYRKCAKSFRRLFSAGLIMAMFFSSQIGCVQRRMLVRSNPPGALVYVDDYEIGTTPVSTNFLYYGTRKLRLVKDGYETLTVLQPIPAPWYQFPPFDFIAENFVPGEIRDQRTLDYQLKPQMLVPNDQLRARAEQLRANNALPAGAIMSRPGETMQPVLQHP